MKPPEELATPEVRLLRWRPDMAESLQEAIADSLPELKPFMAWATDSHGLQESRDYIDLSGREWDAEESFQYAIVAPDGTTIGSSSLMTRMGPGIFEIGYWVHSAYTGRGIATATAGLLAEAGGRLDGIDLIVIKHDVANPASGRVAEKAGFSVVREQPGDRGAPRDSGIDRVWERRVGDVRR